MLFRNNSFFKQFHALKLKFKHFSVLENPILKFKNFQGFQALVETDTNSLFVASVCRLMDSIDNYLHYSSPVTQMAPPLNI